MNKKERERIDNMSFQDAIDKAQSIVYEPDIVGDLSEKREAKVIKIPFLGITFIY